MSRFKILKWLGTKFSFSKCRKTANFFKHYFGGLFQRIDEHHLFLSGGGIAFSLLLSLIPFVLIVFSVFGNILDPSTIEYQLSRIIDAMLPYPKYADYAKQVIISRIPEVIGYKTIAGYLGALGLFVTASWIFSSMRTILNKIFGVTDDKPFLIAMLRDIGMVLLLVIFVVLATFIFPALQVMLRTADKIELFKMFRVDFLLGSGISIFSVTIIFGMFFFFYYLVPYEKLGKRVPLVGAFWATVLWEVARNVFGYYVSNFLSTNKVYGAFVLIIVVLFWLFYSSCLFIIGAEIAQLYRERRALKNQTDPNL